MNTFLFELATRSLILAGIGLALRFALLRSSAHARANVLALTMGALALLPIALLALPRMTVTVAHQELIESPSALTTGAITPVQQFSFPWMIVWVAITSLLIAQVITSLVKFRKLELGFTPASETLTERVKRLAVRAKAVFFCPEGEPPMTWGLLQPKIALPTESEAWIEPQLRSVVLHEDAHIRRKDWAAMIGFRVITAIYWFNPLVWILKVLFEQDSERAADDFVLAQGIDAPEYAGRLVEVAKTLQHRHSRVPAITMARSHRLNGRVAAILSSRTKRGILTGWTRLAVLGILAIGAVSAGMILPVVKQVRLSTKNTDQMVATSDTIVDLKSEDESWNTEDMMAPDDVSDTPPTPLATPQATPKTKSVSLKAPTKTNKPNHISVSMDEPESPEIDMDSISDIVNKGLKQAQIDLKNMPDLNVNIDDKDAQKDQIRANRENQKSIQRDLKEAKNEVETEIRKSLKDAQTEIQKAKLVSDKDLRDAEAKIDKSDIPESAKKMAKQSIHLSKEIVNGLLKGFMEDPTSKKKPKKNSSENKKPKDD
jgi:beta-lactamase regulating signal transducer with metallopeptidase domain